MSWDKQARFLDTDDLYANLAQLLIIITGTFFSTYCTVPLSGSQSNIHNTVKPKTFNMQYR